MTGLPGSAVWLGLFVLLGIWLAVTARHRRSMPTIVDVVRWSLASWAGRALLLGCWAEVGFHVLTQRP